MAKYRCAYVWQSGFRRILSLLLSTMFIVLSAGESWAMEARGMGVVTGFTRITTGIIEIRMEAITPDG
ncbi:MAG: hypothetical protein V8S27_02705 [Lachnospiraceae bacterium]